MEREVGKPGNRNAVKYRPFADATTPCACSSGGQRGDFLRTLNAMAQKLIEDGARVAMSRRSSRSRTASMASPWRRSTSRHVVSSR